MTLHDLILKLTDLRSLVGKDVPVQLYDPDGNGDLNIDPDFGIYWSGDGKVCKRIVLNGLPRESGIENEALEAQWSAEAILKNLPTIEGGE